MVYKYNYYDSNPYYICRRQPSICDGFSLRPLPYPVLLILLVISVFLGIKFTSFYEVLGVPKTTAVQVNWLLLAIPLILVFAVTLLSSVEGPRYFSRYSRYDRRKMGYYGQAGGGGGASPWGVAALIALLLVLVQFQPSLFG